MKSKQRTVVVLAALALCGQALAWPGSGRPQKKVYSEQGVALGGPQAPMIAIAEGDPVDPTQTGKYQIWTNDVHYYIEVRDGKVVEVKRNGEAIPADHVRITADGVKIIDEKGEVVMDAVPGDGSATAVIAQRAARAPRAAGGRPTVEVWRGSTASSPRAMTWAMPATDEPKPPVMIGIRMSQPSRALLRHLGIENGKAILIAGVGEGLPAEQAGIKPYDLLVTIDGKPVTSELTVREVLNERKAKPGDTVTFGVVQGGQRRDVNVTLAAFDEDKMRNGKWSLVEAEDSETSMYSPASPFGQQAPMPPLPPVAPMAPDADMESIRDRIREFERKAREAAEAGRDQAKRDAENSAKALRESLTQRRALGGQTSPYIWSPSTQLSDRMARLEDRLARLEELLEKLADQRGKQP